MRVAFEEIVMVMIMNRNFELGSRESAHVGCLCKQSMILFREIFSNMCIGQMWLSYSCLAT